MVNGNFRHELQFALCLDSVRRLSFKFWEVFIVLFSNGEITFLSTADHSIRSLVRVEGSQVQGVFNFLLNNKSLTPTVGELSGVPPTLLSPSVFVGGTIRHGQVSGSSSTKYVFLLYFLASNQLCTNKVLGCCYLYQRSVGPAKIRSCNGLC